MKLYRPAPHSVPYQLRALLTVARAARGGFAEPQRALVRAMRDVIFAADEDIDADFAPIPPGELKLHLQDDDQALQLIRLMVLLCVADGFPSGEQVTLAAEYADALGVNEPAVKVVSYLADKQLVRFRLAFLPRSHMRHYFRNTYRMAGGVLPVIKALLRFRGVIGEETSTASRFKNLAALPSNTLGYQFYRHCVDSQIAFPGEKGGFPEGAIYHDVTHVLSGCDTSAQGELKNAAFQAGYTSDAHDFFTWLFAMVLHGARVNLTPFPMPNIEGLLGEEGLAENMFRQFERGAAVNVDLGDAWDFWDHAELPIEDVKLQLGVPADRVAFTGPVY